MSSSSSACALDPPLTPSSNNNNHQLQQHAHALSNIPPLSVQPITATVIAQLRVKSPSSITSSPAAAYSQLSLYSKTFAPNSIYSSPLNPQTTSPPTHTHHISSSSSSSSVHDASPPSTTSHPSAAQLAKQRSINKDNTQRQSCHQCKTMRDLRHLLVCRKVTTTTKPNSSSVKQKKCKYKYCRACLIRLYYLNMDKMSDVDLASWCCPSCLFACVCAACRKRVESPPVQLHPQTGLPITSPYEACEGFIPEEQRDGYALFKELMGSSESTEMKGVDKESAHANANAPSDSTQLSTSSSTTTSLSSAPVDDAAPSTPPILSSALSMPVHGSTHAPSGPTAPASTGDTPNATTAAHGERTRPMIRRGTMPATLTAHTDSRARAPSPQHLEVHTDYPKKSHPALQRRSKSQSKLELNTNTDEVSPLNGTPSHSPGPIRSRASSSAAPSPGHSPRMRAHPYASSPSPRNASRGSSPAPHIIPHRARAESFDVSASRANPVVQATVISPRHGTIVPALATVVATADSAALPLYHAPQHATSDIESHAETSSQSSEAQSRVDGTHKKNQSMHSISTDNTTKFHSADHHSSASSSISPSPSVSTSASIDELLPTLQAQIAQFSKLGESIQKQLDSVSSLKHPAMTLATLQQHMQQQMQLLAQIQQQERLLHNSPFNNEAQQTHSTSSNPSIFSAPPLNSQFVADNAQVSVSSSPRNFSTPQDHTPSSLPAAAPASTFQSSIGSNAPPPPINHAEMIRQYEYVQSYLRTLPNFNPQLSAQQQPQEASSAHAESPFRYPINSAPNSMAFSPARPPFIQTNHINVNDDLVPSPTTQNIFQRIASGSYSDLPPEEQDSVNQFFLRLNSQPYPSLLGASSLSRPLSNSSQMSAPGFGGMPLPPWGRLASNDETVASMPRPDISNQHGSAPSSGMPPWAKFAPEDSHSNQLNVANPSNEGGAAPGSSPADISLPGWARTASGDIIMENEVRPTLINPSMNHPQFNVDALFNPNWSVNGGEQQAEFNRQSSNTRMS